MEETLIATSPPLQQPPLKFTDVLSDSRRLIKSQPRRVLAVTFLFLLPLSIASAVYSIIQNLSSDPLIPHNYFLNQTNTNTTSVPDHDLLNQTANTIATNAILLDLTYFLFYLVLYVSAVGSITYTAFHSLQCQPVKPAFSSTYKSIATSFFQLLATTLLVDAILLALSIIFVVLFISVIRLPWLLGFHIQTSSPYFIAICFAMVVLFLSVSIYLQVNWGLASVVVVAESTWGFEALKRSKILVKGRRVLVLAFCLIFRFCCVVLERSTIYALVPVLVTDKRKSCCFLLPLFLRIVIASSLKSLLMLFEIVVNTVMYVCCKALHDGVEFGAEYDVRLLHDSDNKTAAHGLAVYLNYGSKLDAYSNEV